MYCVLAHRVIQDRSQFPSDKSRKGSGILSQRSAIASQVFYLPSVGRDVHRVCFQISLCAHLDAYEQTRGLQSDEKKAIPFPLYRNSKCLAWVYRQLVL